MTRKLFAAIICTIVATSSVVGPAQALQMPKMPETSSSDAITVQYSGGYNQGHSERPYQGNNERRYHEYSDRHYRWCEDRYNSYRRESNSYWTRGGEQRQCNSPYS